MEQTTISILASASVGLLAYGCCRLAGTTLLAPGLWAMAAVAGIAGSELAIAAVNPGDHQYWIESLRYAMAMATFCPAMAVLGAKRPQDRGWQWVVFSLWVVLVTPALQTTLFRTGVRVSPFLAWNLLIAVLLLLQCSNYLLSRHRWAVALWTTAQFILLRPHWISSVDPGAKHVLTALALVLASLVVVWFRGGLRQTGNNRLETLWRGFTDAYGTFWTFRLMGFINQTAVTAHWPVRLMPWGFVPEIPDESVDEKAQLAPALQVEIRQAMRNTLRRFLSQRDLQEQLDG